MNMYLDYLTKNIDLNNYKLLKTTHNKILIFKSTFKYTKCIYITYTNDLITIRIDKVFDFYYIENNIERLIISSQVFNDFDKSISFIQKNIAI